MCVQILPSVLHCFIGNCSVERYDPRQNKWTNMAPMSTRRKHLGCAVFNNMIYAVGGRDDCMELSSAERYNPHTNSWSPIVAMTSRRSGVSIFPHCIQYPVVDRRSESTFDCNLTRDLRILGWFSRC